MKLQRYEGIRTIVGKTAGIEQAELTITNTDNREQKLQQNAIAQANGTEGIEPVADYEFQNDLSSSIAGAPDLVDLGNNSFNSEIIDGESATVFEFAEQTGLQLSTTDLISNDEYSISMLFELNNVNGFNKIFDFQDRTADSGLYNDPDGNLDFFNIASGNDGFEANKFVQVVLTREDSTDELTGFVEGKEVFSVTDEEELAVFSSENLLTLFRDESLFLKKI